MMNNYMIVRYPQICVSLTTKLGQRKLQTLFLIII